jgi:ElaB/YqjD/DUF883 family membrane-anchored ribosome-binding protein
MTTTNKTDTHSDDRIGQRIEQAGDRLIEIKQEVTRSLGTRIESLGGLIKDHPFAALGIGLGIGYLAARILHR